MIQRLRDKLRDDKGVATIYFVIMTVAFLAIIGLVVDGAGKVQANQQAYSTADGAARAAANAAAKALSNRPDEYDGLFWAKHPKCQKAMDMVIDGAKRSDKLRQVLDDLISMGVVSTAGKLLKRYKGQGQWVTA